MTVYAHGHTSREAVGLGAQIVQSSLREEEEINQQVEEGDWDRDQVVVTQLL